MNGLVGHFLILVGAGVAAGAVSFAIERPAGADLPGGSPSIVLAQMRPPARSAPEVAAVPENRDGLARLLQRELTRIGCYGGTISGVWGKAPRQAMRAFLVHINATLPVDQPDEILLRLVQAEQQRVCAEPCPAEHDAPAQGTCAPDGLAAKVSAQPAPPAPTAAKANTSRPASGPASGPAPGPDRGPDRGPAPGPAAGPEPGTTAPRMAADAVAPADGGASARSEDAAAAQHWRLAGVPPGQQPPRAAAPPSDELGAREPMPPAPHFRPAARRTRKVRPAKKPPKIVRLLIRNLERLAPFGMR
jgi:hypothetical protein